MGGGGARAGSGAGGGSGGAGGGGGRGGAGGLELGPHYCSLGLELTM